MQSPTKRQKRAMTVSFRAPVRVDHAESVIFSSEPAVAATMNAIVPGRPATDEIWTSRHRSS